MDIISNQFVCIDTTAKTLSNRIILTVMLISDKHILDTMIREKAISVSVFPRSVEDVKLVYLRGTKDQGLL